MRSLTKVLGAIGIAAALMTSVAGAHSRFDRSYSDRSYDAYDSVGAHHPSIPYDAGGPAYTSESGGQNSPSDFQLQGR